MGKNIGFVSTRFAGTDGVTLESSKWADVLENDGHRCFWFAGELDRDARASLLVPEAHFQHPQNQWIHAGAFGCTRRRPEVTRAIHAMRSLLNERLHHFMERFSIDLLIAENVLAIPMNLPLGLALTEVIAESQVPTIAHHHDFYWERTRFCVNAVGDYLRMAFPPGLPNVRHTVINSEAREQLALRAGISSTIIPNVLDFDNPPPVNLLRADRFRRCLGIEPGETMILQPTRVVKRKGIEHAVELARGLRHLGCKLVISHEAGDEGFEYLDWLKEYAVEREVDLRLVATRVQDPWQAGIEGKAGYCLWDVYPLADFVTYPSLYEGFGNAFLEAVYFRRPILINRYATFVRDIEPLGFDLAVMDGFLSKQTVGEVVDILRSPARKRRMVETNYAVAARHFSYGVLQKKLDRLVDAFSPLKIEKRTAEAAPAASLGGAWDYDQALSFG